jgi:hypothetical protein
MKNSSTSAHIQAWNVVYFLVSHGRAEYGDMCLRATEKQILKIKTVLASLSGKMV